MVHKLDIDIILLQEIWHPDSAQIKIHNYTQYFTKTRINRQGGGVAIITRNNVKAVHMKQYEVEGLEAIWADVLVNKIRTLVGSVYIPPSDMEALNKLDTVIGSIVQTHDQVLIAMDANARNALWEDNVSGIPYRKSFKMGEMLEEICDKYSLHIHNSGISTYNTGNIHTSPDVTVSTGMFKYGNISWSIIDDDLRSPHDGILIQIGDKLAPRRKEVINWPKFDWATYQKLTGDWLQTLYDKWITYPDLEIESMVDEITQCIQQAVNIVSTKKVITEHSKPWIDAQISEQLKLLRNLRHKCRLRKSPVNVAELSKVQQETSLMLQRAENQCRMLECRKLDKVNDVEKWKIIQRLTNQTSNQGMQPLRKIEHGNTTYLFDDTDIRNELENFHIRKSSEVAKSVSQFDDNIRRSVNVMVHEAKLS